MRPPLRRPGINAGPRRTKPRERGYRPRTSFDRMTHSQGHFMALCLSGPAFTPGYTERIQSVCELIAQPRSRGFSHWLQPPTCFAGLATQSPARPEELAATIYHALDVPLNAPPKTTAASPAPSPPTSHC